MSLLLKLSGLALRQVVHGAMRWLGQEVGQAAVGPVVTFLTERFTDPSQRLPQALRDANAQAWHALEASLTAESLWSRICLAVSSGDVRAFRQRVLALLEGLPGEERFGLGVEEFRDLCRNDLHRARADGLLLRGTLEPRQLAEQAGQFAAFGNADLVAAEWCALDDLGQNLLIGGYPYLGRFVLLREQGWPLLALASRYFLSKRLEKDEALFKQVMLQRDGGLTPTQKTMFGEMHALLIAHGNKLDELLDLNREHLALTRENRAMLLAILARLEAVAVPLVHPVEVTEVAEVLVVEIEKEPEPERVASLAPGEPIPAVPPRYSRRPEPEGENRATMTLREELWTNNATVANPGANLGAIAEPAPVAEKPKRSVLGAAFLAEAESEEPAEEQGAEETTDATSDEPERPFGIPSIFE